MTDVGQGPPDDAVEIGPRSRIEFCEFKGDTAGIKEWHQKDDGNWCCGWVAFAGSTWAKGFTEEITTWNVIQREPLTLQPSIKCRACGNHGHITNGRWVPA